MHAKTREEPNDTGTRPAPASDRASLASLSDPLQRQDARPDLLACNSCGLVQRGGSPAPGHVLVCTRCSAALRASARGTRRLAAVCVGTAVPFLLLATREPLFQIRLLGRFSSASLLSGPRMLAARGASELGGVVLLTLLLAPSLHLLLLALAVLGSHLPRPPRGLMHVLRWLEATRRWSMFDVYLLALLVCYVRLQGWTHVEVGSAVLAMVALVLITFACEAAIDLDALWARCAWHVPVPRAAGAQLIGCEACSLVNRADEGAPCVRCGKRLALRKHDALHKASALLLTATLLSVPANVLPVMDMVQFGRADSNTVLSGVMELTQHHLWGLALVIFVASVVIPLLKIVGLAAMLVLTIRGDGHYLRARTRAYQIVRGIGRWSLVDVFAVTILVSIVRLGILASVLPRYGAVAFCAVVVVTMLAAECFDPRAMWDAAGMNKNCGRTGA